MKKIPTLFKRDPENMSRLLPEVNPVCQWVLDGEGVATKKIDGTSCMFDGTVWWKRREVKKGKPVPEGFKEETFDETTGKRTGWMPIDESDKWHLEAIGREDNQSGTPNVGTYELVGPKIQGNPEKWETHLMVQHETVEQFDIPVVGYEQLQAWLSENYVEGIVWHHPDGRMAKIKRRDYRLKWP